MTEDTCDASQGRPGPPGPHNKEDNILDLICQLYDDIMSLRDRDMVCRMVKVVLRDEKCHLRIR